MWGGMMWPSLETTPKTIIVAGNFVFITLGTSLLFVAIQRWFWQWSCCLGKEHDLYSGASPISLVENCVTFRHDRRLISLLGLVHNWPTSRWSATKKENWFSLNGNGIISSFLGRQFYRSTLYVWKLTHDERDSFDIIEYKKILLRNNYTKNVNIHKVNAIL